MAMQARRDSHKNQRAHQRNLHRAQELAELEFKRIQLTYKEFCVNKKESKVVTPGSKRLKRKLEDQSKLSKEDVSFCKKYAQVHKENAEVIEFLKKIA